MWKDEIPKRKVSLEIDGLLDLALALHFGNKFLSLQVVLMCPDGIESHLGQATQESKALEPY